MGLGVRFWLHLDWAWAEAGVRVGYVLGFGLEALVGGRILA